MLRKIAAFELRYQLRSPLFLICFAIFFIFTLVSVVSDRIQIGARGNVHVNSPFAIMQTNGTLTLFALFVLVAFVANAVIRDDQSGFAPIIRTTRITKFDYLLGRFLGAWLVSVAVIAAVPLAIFLGSFSPTIDPQKLGPNVAWFYVSSTLVYSAPTLLTVGAGLFALATVTRSMMWCYVGLIGFFVLTAIADSLLSDPSRMAAAALVDPFGLNAFSEATRYWTASERNTQMPRVEGLLLYNRLIWIGIAGALFVLAYRLFRFDAVGASPKKQVLSEAEVVAAGIPIGARDVVVRPLNPSVWTRFIALTRFDMAFVFKGAAFFVLLVLGVLISLVPMFSAIDMRGTVDFPVTRAMIDALFSSFSIFPTLIAVYYSGELVWRDRDQRIHELVDSTSAPNWTFLAPKVLAIVLMILACYVVGALTAIGFQLAHGYTNLQLGAYLVWFILPALIFSIILVALAVVVQALVPHKAIGWAVMLVYFVIRISLGGLGFEHDLYIYGGAPGVPLSDMNGMGRFWIGRAWFQVYWLAFALLLLVAAQLLWRRGVDTNFMPRLRRVAERWRGVTRVLTVGACVVWLAVGGYIFYNTNILNDYETGPERERLQANYEKALLPFEKQPQPRITAVNLAVDIEPKAVRATTVGSYVIENRTTAPLKEVHVRWVRPLQMLSLEVEGANMTKEYAEYDYRIYTFVTPLQPHEKRSLRFKSLLEQRGFKNSGNLTEIVDNGTFLNNLDIAPLLGMSRGQLLQDRSKRRKYGLPPELRVPKLEDESARANNYLRNDSDWVTAKIQVTTDADQTPVAPGYTVSDTVNGNRRTLVTQTEAPIMHFFSIQSARYAVKKDSVTIEGDQPVELAVYYHPEHDHNVQRMLNAMKVSLEMFGEKFSPFQFKQARVLEFPAYAAFAQSFANTIPYSEGIGFIQNYNELKSDEQIDLVTYVTAHEIGHQWWAHQIIGSNQQGMTLLSETFAQYSALLVMEKLYGKEQIRKFLKYELDNYLRSRGGELIEELPLMRVENQLYIHYQKGGLVMYWLKEVVGEEAVNQALRGLLAEYAFKAAPYPTSLDFLRHLRAAAPGHEALISDLFEKITVYDMKANNATAKKLPDGKYRVTFTIEGRKLYADGQGKETEAPLDEPFDVGVFTAEPGKKGYHSDAVLLMERRQMKSGKQTVELTVDKVPKFVGIDPYNKRIDRNSDDNLTKVELQNP